MRTHWITKTEQIPMGWNEKRNLRNLENPWAALGHS